jgi:cell wall-associated NlpC family hydrolase
VVLAAPLPHPPAVVRHHTPAPLSLRIARQARALVGTPNRRYLPTAPRRACAAFCSTVLVKVGALLPKFRSASAAQLTRNLLHAGWRRVVGPVPVNSRAARASRPGDVLAFGPCGGSGIAHVGISTGRDQFVGISSSRGRVRRWTLSQWISQRCVRLYRHR